jgi:spore maturation protein CgeB
MGQNISKPLAIVGNAGATNVGESLRRAAVAAGYPVVFFDARAAGGPRLLRTLNWRLRGHRPTWLGRFSANVAAACLHAQPGAIIGTGAAPLIDADLRKLRAAGIVCLNYSTDDPWNSGSRADWHLRALPNYDVIFTPRRANLEDFRRLGCRDVRYLPFGYDEWLFGPLSEPGTKAAVHDVLFVGGADPDRVAFMTEFLRRGPSVALVGAYWDRYPSTRPYAQGHKPPAELYALTAAAKVNLCLVRRANRDGHVMRSFEIAAIGGCMLVEDTDEHREIFGPDGDAVIYFRTASDAADSARKVLGDQDLQIRLADRVKSRILSNAHKYSDRLGSMLDVVEQSRPPNCEARVALSADDEID